MIHCQKLIDYINLYEHALTSRYVLNQFPAHINLNTFQNFFSNVFKFVCCNIMLTIFCNTVSIFCGISLEMSVRIGELVKLCYL